MPKLKPMTDRERSLVAAFGNEIKTLTEQLADRDKEIARLRDENKRLMRPTFGFDDED